MMNMFLKSTTTLPHFTTLHHYTTSPTTTLPHFTTLHQYTTSPTTTLPHFTTLHQYTTSPTTTLPHFTTLHNYTTSLTTTLPSFTTLNHFTYLRHFSTTTPPQPTNSDIMKKLRGIERLIGSRGVGRSGGGRFETIDALAVANQIESGGWRRLADSVRWLWWIWGPICFLHYGVKAVAEFSEELKGYGEAMLKIWKLAVEAATEEDTDWILGDFFGL